MKLLTREKFVENALIKVACDTKTSLGAAIENDLHYKRRNACEAVEFPFYSACLHYSNSVGNEGLMICIALIADRVSLTDPVTREIEGKLFAFGGETNVKCHEIYSAIGYGDRWKRYAIDAAEISGACTKSHCVPVSECVFVKTKELEKYFNPKTPDAGISEGVKA
jgi:hypothetical protein